MTAKQYLRQAYRLQVKIDIDKELVEHLRARTESPPTINYGSDKVQISGVNDRLGETIAKIVDLESLILDEVNRLIDLKREIWDRINAMPDDDLRLVLQMRYINLKKWEQIAIDMGCTYQWAHTLHRRAIKLFSTVYKSLL